ncbi:FBD-associated F-box protein [Rhynchospora pubera]|uniref:FBD-associated F-box protein n=1 Tax=Rhynchospora pubera TaxID=906938 RepID=A0AAV8CW79_9POAL|nr:FBD-associated F-box protein [Rhynchospora pubera]
MKASQSQKLKQASDAGFDFLSNLPDLVKVKILALLPFKEAVRTSTLSKCWRHTWFSMPSLVIYEDEIGFQTLSEFITFVYRLLSSHAHSMAKLKLVFRHRYNYERPDIKEDLVKWINTILEKHVHELVLDSGYYSTIEIPDCLFSLPELEVLNLKCFELNVPKHIDGFKMIHSLKLDTVNITGIEIERLVLSCPLLKYFLIRTKYLGLNDLAIRSPSLLELDIDADFKDLYLETPKLVTLSASIISTFVTYDIYNEPVYDDDEEYDFPSKYENNISRLMCCLPQVENLDICYNFVRYLDGGVVPAQLPVSLNLTKMTIEFATEYSDVARCLLQSAPRSCYLHAKFHSEEIQVFPPWLRFWDDAGAIDCQLNQLKTVILGNGCYYAKCIVSFVKYILKSAPILEIVGFEEPEDTWSRQSRPFKETMKEVLKLPRLSNKAIIKMIRS